MVGNDEIVGNHEIVGNLRMGANRHGPTDLLTTLLAFPVRFR